jgi:hypothetical protein
VSLRRLAHAAEVTRPAVEFESFGTSAGARGDSSGSPNLDCAWVSLNRYGPAKTGRKYVGCMIPAGQLTTLEVSDLCPTDSRALPPSA